MGDLGLWLVALIDTAARSPRYPPLSQSDWIDAYEARISWAFSRDRSTWRIAFTGQAVRS